MIVLWDIISKARDMKEAHIGDIRASGQDLWNSLYYHIDIHVHILFDGPVLGSRQACYSPSS